MCQRGAIDADLAECFGVSESTINLWKKTREEFSESLKRGKSDPDDLVERALFERAVGYTHPAMKALVVDKKIYQLTYTQHYPPDTGAIAFWLKNRRKEKWRDRQEGNVDESESLDAILQKVRERVASRNGQSKTHECARVRKAEVPE
jgi:hypothetical protein